MRQCGVMKKNLAVASNIYGISTHWVSLVLVCKLAPMHKGQWETTEKAVRLVGSSFTQPGNLHMNRVLGCSKTSTPLLPSARILKVYIEVLKLASVMYSTQLVSTIPCSLTAVSLKTAPATGTMGIMYISTTGRGSGRKGGEISLWLPGSTPGSTTGHILSLTSSNTWANNPTALSSRSPLKRLVSIYWNKT